jgi:hypothetical protein
VIPVAESDDGGLIEDDALAADVDQRVRRAEIDGEVLREQLAQYSSQDVQARRRPRRCRISRRSADRVGRAVRGPSRAGLRAARLGIVES